jgi:hypothetical protein
MREKRMLVDVQWLGVAAIESLNWQDPRLKKYFNLRPHSNLFGQFGIPQQHWVVSYSLTPTDGFHRLLTRSMAELGPVGESTHAPYDTIPVDDLFSFTITSVTADIFPGGIVIARVKGKLKFESFHDWIQTRYSELRSFRTPRLTAVVDKAIRHVFALAKADRGSVERRSPYGDYFTMRLLVPAGKSAIADLLATRRQELAGLLIGMPNSSELGEGVVDSILRENSSLNEKASSEILLLNAQGALHVLPGDGYVSPHHKRLQKVADLATLAQFAKTFLRDDSRYSINWPTFAGFLGDKLAHWVESPTLAFSSSYANMLTWERLSQVLSLHEHLSVWRAALPNSRRVVEQRSASKFLKDVWWEVPDVEALLEEEHATKPDPLSFVIDTELHDFISGDREEAKRCAATGNYRAAIVMAGAAIEGVLLALVLSDRPNTDRTGLLRKNLRELIEECCPSFNRELGRSESVPRRLIHRETAKFIDYTCRPWRNYVHPGLTLRAEQPANSEMAVACISALELLIRQVS